MENIKSYARIWRWHFFAGLFLSPMLVTLAVTGLVYLFQPQVEPVIYKKWLDVPVSSERIAPQAQLNAALGGFPGSKAYQVIVDPREGKSTQVFLSDSVGHPITVYVNPYNGSIVGSQRTDRALMQLMHDIHGSLLLGKPGAIIMEMTAGWAFILVTTGLFLWWPRNKDGAAGVLWPRFSSSGRGFWRDLHAVPAFYLSALIFLFLFTGLPWTGITGDIIAKIGRATGTGSPPGFGPSPFKTKLSADAPTISLDRLVEISMERLPADAAPEIQLSNDGVSAALIRWLAPKPQDRAYIHVDAKSGEVVADYRWNDFGWIGKAVLLGVALHMGKWFGPWNQVLNTIVALGVLLLVGTGIVMWWKRRPRGAFLAAPQPSMESRLPVSLWILIGSYCVLVPPAGVSLIVIMTIDFIFQRVFIAQKPDSPNENRQRRR